MGSPLDSVAKSIGAAFQNVFYSATLTRSVAGKGPSYDPGAPSTAVQTCRALDDHYNSFQRSSGLVEATDVKVMITATSLPVGFTPQPGDQIAFRGLTLRVVSSGEGQPAVSIDPARAMWELRCRS